MEKDIKKAIEKEKEYLAYRRKGIEPYALTEALKEFGFNSLSEYSNRKKDYEFLAQRFAVVETTPISAIAEVLQAIMNKRTVVLFADTTSTIVWRGDNSELNESYCLKNNIPILPLHTKGGTIVSTKGDLNIGICFQKKAGLDLSYILNGFADIFHKYTAKEIIVSGNDIIVDGYKVLGSSTYAINDMFVFITPVSLTEKSELINSICVKHSSKVPGYIDFMSSDMLRKEVLGWLQIT